METERGEMRKGEKRREGAGSEGKGTGRDEERKEEKKRYGCGRERKGRGATGRGPERRNEDEKSRGECK